MSQMMCAARRHVRAKSLIGAAALAAVIGTGAWVNAAERTQIAQNASPAPGIVIPFTDPDRGRELFVGKGCVICHSVNGVGGRAGPPLDADPTQTVVDVFDFAARMWRGAPAMIVLQEMELGYQIELTGEELGQIAHFAHSAEAQARFSHDDIPDLIKDWMVDDTYERLDEIRNNLGDFFSAEPKLRD